MSSINPMLTSLAGHLPNFQPNAYATAAQPMAWSASLPYGRPVNSAIHNTPVQISPFSWQAIQAFISSVLGNGGNSSWGGSFNSNPFASGLGSFPNQGGFGQMASGFGSPAYQAGPSYTQPQWGGGFGQMASGFGSPAYQAGPSYTQPQWGGGFGQMTSGFGSPAYYSSSAFAQPSMRQVSPSIYDGGLNRSRFSNYTAFQDITHDDAQPNTSRRSGNTFGAQPPSWGVNSTTGEFWGNSRQTNWGNIQSTDDMDASRRDRDTRHLNFNNVNYIFGKQNVNVKDGGKSADILYPEGSASPSMGKIGGASFQTNLGLRPSDEMTLNYKVTFGEGFDFRNGGKLPGLAGGTANSGGRQPNGHDGWSARIDFRKDGAAEIYAYLPTQKNADIQALKKGDKGFSLGRVEGVFKPGKTYEIEERVKMNTPGKANGRLQLYVNGEKIVDQKDLVISNSPKLKADKLMFSTFFGGSKNEDRTTKDEKVKISDVSLSTPKSSKKESPEEKPEKKKEA